MKGINQKQGQAVEPDMTEKKKPFIRTVLKGAGLLFLFLFITGMIGNFFYTCKIYLLIIRI